MARFLTDENIPPSVIQYLKSKGLDVRAIREFVPAGSPDLEVITVARQEGRILLTFDKHFANILLYPLGTHVGIIRIRLHPPLIGDILDTLDNFFRNVDLNEIRGSLVILERDGFRIRRKT
jgi:predicted nuclease of predicted toxin-antitoxin system